MAVQKLTTGRIKGLKHPEKGQVFYWDSVTPGLGVRVTTTSKVFVFQGRLDGKTIRVKIGDTRTWTIDNSDPKSPGARQEARRLQGLIDKGLDPRVEKQERLEQQAAKRSENLRKETTLAEVWTEYLKDRKPHWSERHYNDHLNIAHLGGAQKKRGNGKTKPAVLASLMTLLLSDLTPQTVRRWATKEATRRGTQTRLAFALLRAMAHWCEEQQAYKGLCDLSAFSGKIKKDTLPAQNAREDSLQREQLTAWFTAVRKSPNNIIAAYLQALLLTGARREELLRLQWSDVDFTWKSLTIRDKIDGQRTIPLTPYVADLLLRLPQRNNWVFSSPRSKSGRLQEPRKAHEKALAEAGIENLTIHGLRRSFSNLTEWIEAPVGVVYQIMGHKPSATAEKHYKKRPLDLLRMWHTKIEAWILREAGIPQPETDKKPRIKLVAHEGG